MEIDKNKLTLVLGGSGRIGRFLDDLLYENGYTFIRPSHRACNLLDHYSCEHMWYDYKPTYVIMLAAKTTTIALNKTEPASICRDTLLMNMNVLEMCRKYGVDKLVNVVSSCAYGESDLLVEDQFLRGNIHESVSPHGEAKKMTYLMSQFYCTQHNLPVTTVCFNNICGAEQWDKPDSLKVLSALVKKIVDARNANNPFVNVWGTGQACREFIHAKDAATGLFHVFNNYSGNLINIGSGRDYSIEYIAYLIKALAKYDGNLFFDHSKPDGQIKKLLDVTRQSNILNWHPIYKITDIVNMLITEYEEFLECIVK